MASFVVTLNSPTSYACNLHTLRLYKNNFEMYAQFSFTIITQTMKYLHK